MADMLQRTFANTFYECKISYIILKFVPYGLIPQVNIGLGLGFALNKWKAISWANDGPVHRHLYKAPGFIELMIWKLLSQENISLLIWNIASLSRKQFEFLVVLQYG